MWKILSHEISDPSYGKYPGARSGKDKIKNSLLILDKPRGPTSHDVTAQVKKILGLEKAGHSGTLDPKVSGVLVIALENSCKIMPALKNMKKEYVGVMQLHKDVDKKKLEKEVEKFRGKIKQVPPVRSAVARKERIRTVHSFDILDRKERFVCFKIKCDAGTYIRKIISDLGKKIGGAHMKELRRTMVGYFDEGNSYTINELKKLGIKASIPMEMGIEKLGKIIVKDSAVNSLCNGAHLYHGGVARMTNLKKNQRVGILTGKGELIALGTALLDKELIAKPDRVVMKKGVYPDF